MQKLMILLVSLTLFAFSCDRGTPERTGDDPESVSETQSTKSDENYMQREEVSLTRITEREVTEPVRLWLSASLQFGTAPYVSEFVHEGKRYLLAARGRRNTGGYEVRFLDAEAEGDTVRVRIRFTRPPADAMVTQVITYPHDIAVISDTARTVQYVKEGNDVPSQFYPLVGIDRIKPITAQSEHIKIFSPAPGTSVDRNIRVTGTALVFEGTVNYRLRDMGGSEIVSGFTTTATGLGWGYYEFSLPVPEGIRAGEQVTIELFYIDMDSGDERDHVRVEVNLGE
jgi:hypothetical protein